MCTHLRSLTAVSNWRKGDAGAAGVTNCQWICHFCFAADQLRPLVFEEAASGKGSPLADGEDGQLIACKTKAVGVMGEVWRLSERRSSEWMDDGEAELKHSSTPEGKAISALAVKNQYLLINFRRLARLVKSRWSDVCVGTLPPFAQLFFKKKGEKKQRLAGD